MKRSPYDIFSRKGNSTCATKCDDGYTANGDIKFICSKCDPSCATCEDDGNVGDNKRCVTCNQTTHPFLLARKKECHKFCGQGLYEVKPANIDKNAKYTKACDECAKPCHDCFGNRVNCTACDPKSNVSGLFLFAKKT